MRSRTLILLLLLLTVCAPGAQQQQEIPIAAAARTSPKRVPERHFLLAAGDIASCSVETDSQTARIVEGQDGTVAVLGDLAYESGSAREFADCYHPAWGKFRDRTRPAPGNHEYQTEGATPYFDYFGELAGTRGQGWYSYRLGSWHVVALNSVCTHVGCGEGSAQLTWLRENLRSNPSDCVLAYWHHPRWSSGPHQHNDGVGPFWEALYAAGADVVLSGHDHAYERFEPLNPQAQPDPGRGITQFIVGTGGRSLYGLKSKAPGSVVRNDREFGVLKLTLSKGSYSWDFLPVEGGQFEDSGRAKCSGAPGSGQGMTSS